MKWAFSQGEPWLALAACHVKKIPRLLRGLFFKVRGKSLALCHARSALGIEAGLAENRAATLLDGTGLERNLAGCAALRASRVVHLAVLQTLALAGVAAILAALGSAQVLARVELLFTIGERKLLTAIAAL